MHFDEADKVGQRVRREHGGVLIAALAFVVVIAFIMAGIASLAVGHYSRAEVEQNHELALAEADAGLNYELRKISDTPSSFDQLNNTTTYTLGGGSYKVYCTNRDGTNWTPGNSLYIYSTGAYGSSSRTVQMAGRGFPVSGPGNYALFGVSQGIMDGNNSVTGDVGTDGLFTFNGTNNITGGVYFNGSGSGWQSAPSATYTTVYSSTAIAWPTVETIASGLFSGGLTHVASNNDNATASPAIVNNTVSIGGNTTLTLYGKAGGANYYLTSLTCSGNSSIYFNNTNGPITIWCGPSGTSGTFTFNGGTAAVKYSSDQTKPVKIYVATTNDLTFNGNNELDAGIYNVNNSGLGRVVFNGNPTIYGSVISNMFTLNGTSSIRVYQASMFPTPGTSYYGLDNVWHETGGVWD